MARPRSHKPLDASSKRRPQLTIPKDEARQQIRNRVTKGEELLSRTIASTESLDQFASDLNSWTDFNKELLTRIFDADDYATEYSRYPGGPVFSGMSIQQRIKYKRDMLEEYLRRLRSLDDRLDLIPQVPLGIANQSAGAGEDVILQRSRRIFLVHGHDVALKESVARFLEKLGLDPIILHEQPSQSRTIIEKFETHSDVAFAVVLLTPDDVGGDVANKDKLMPRPRQNVVFELGYFVGKLGRMRVCALHMPGIELLSDWSGVLYIPFDQAGGWHLLLAREIKAAGIDVDLNKAI